MKRKRLPKRLKVASLLFLGSVPFVCCFLWCLGLPIKQETTLGVRKDAEGNVIQEIILEVSSKTDIPLPGPHGPISLFRRPQVYKYFLQEPGKPRRELAFLAHDLDRFFDENSCWPVDDSSVWVHVSRFQRPTVLVFNDMQVLHRFWPTCELELEGTHDLYSFANGNRTLVYRRSQGYQAYDVITGVVMDWKPPKR